MNRKSTAGAYTITGRGIDTSSVTLGSAISKAQTIAGRVQRALGENEELRSLYIRRLGEEAVARIDVHRNVIKTFVKTSR